jgi:phage terminase small subunit
LPNSNVPGPVPAKVPNDTIRGPNRKLTRRQEKFVKELVANDGLITLREAAIRAGYPPRSAHSRAWELTNNNISPHVVSEIARYREELDEQYGVTYKRHIKDMHRLREICIQQGALSAAVQAEKNRGLAEGLYVSKSEIRTGSIDQMSREDVERELEKIRAGFEQIIDVTPEAVEVEEPDAEVSAKKPRKRPVANNKRRAKGKQKKDSDDAP